MAGDDLKTNPICREASSDRGISAQVQSTGSTSDDDFLLKLLAFVHQRSASEASTNDPARGELGFDMSLLDMVHSKRLELRRMDQNHALKLYMLDKVCSLANCMLPFLFKIANRTITVLFLYWLYRFLGSTGADLSLQSVVELARVLGIAH